MKQLLRDTDFIFCSLHSQTPLPKCSYGTREWSSPRRDVQLNLKILDEASSSNSPAEETPSIAVLFTLITRISLLGFALLLFLLLFLLLSFPFRLLFRCLPVVPFPLLRVSIP